VQLACRHPGFTGSARRVVEGVARTILQQLATDPDLRTLADAGWAGASPVDWSAAGPVPVRDVVNAGDLLARAKREGRPISPGVYELEGVGHVDLEERCRHFGYEPTPDTLARVRSELAADLGAAGR
jgi:hypothetical protein